MDDSRSKCQQTHHIPKKGIDTYRHTKSLKKMTHMILIQSDLCRVLATITFFEKLRRLMIHPLESVELVIWGLPWPQKSQ